ncbi:hypothetical protein [Staphylococcus aureus]|uniref:hypothetical protein n=1 Tax=Staphylococcus aureus TaxID=1280 RepID=UPI0018ED909C|nr:hypothetical protein [Staphylococcus aureus]MBJ6234568.1 hypothetical protein [Staphylococcus aureus]MBJ6252663.1 hypothetical protein [Staphylococcus aureus]MBJ6292097.1 hypothetical protein [Staphylococcus aureus]MBJ6342929.1 hypothetical protein [Staphylococcus aureus]MBJ6359634.1 hypothetical protein [Staphylococcus aureus]
MNKHSELQAKKNQLELDINRNNFNDRKQRTRRLIQKGALLEKYFQCDNLSPEETEELLKVFANYINSNKPNKFKKE